MHKLFGRIWQMALSGLYSIVPLLGSIVVSAWVISVSSQNVWGTFVAVLLLLDVAFSVINWGAKEYLMREFSQNPAMIARLLSSSMSSRFPLLLLFLCLIPFFHFTNGSIPAIIILCLSRYIQRSFDALLQYNRSFLFSAINETAGIIIIFLILFPVKNSLSPELIVSAFAWSAAAKAISTALYFRNNISPKYLFKFDSRMLLYSMPFLLQSFSGIIQQRADLFAVVYFLEKKDAAQYQVLTSFLGFMQLAATLLLFPFIKNIFRFNNERFSRLSKNYSTSGIFLAAIKVMILFAVIHNVYHFYFSWQMYLLAYLYTLAFYFYYTHMIDFTRNHRQYTAVFITLICSMANVIFTVLLTPVLRLEGALLSGTMVQWLMVALLTYSSGKTFRLEKLFHG